MQKVCPRTGFFAAALLIAFTFVSASSASAQEKKVTYDQAWAKCKAEIAKNVSPDEKRDTAARYAAGGACMKKYGYKMKKSTKM